MKTSRSQWFRSKLLVAIWGRHILYNGPTVESASHHISELNDLGRNCQSWSGVDIFCILARPRRELRTISRWTVTIVWHKFLLYFASRMKNSYQRITREIFVNFSFSDSSYPSTCIFWFWLWDFSAAVRDLTMDHGWFLKLLVSSRWK